MGAHDDEESPLLDDGWVIWIHGLYYEKPPWLMVNLGMVYDFVLLEYSVFDIYIYILYIYGGFRFVMGVPQSSSKSSLMTMT